VATGVACTVTCTAIRRLLWCCLLQARLAVCGMLNGAGCCACVLYIFLTIQNQQLALRTSTILVPPLGLKLCFTGMLSTFLHPAGYGEGAMAWGATACGRVAVCNKQHGKQQLGSGRRCLWLGKRPTRQQAAVAAGGLLGSITLGITYTTGCSVCDRRVVNISNVVTVGSWHQGKMLTLLLRAHICSSLLSGSC